MKTFKEVHITSYDIALSRLDGLFIVSMCTWLCTNPGFTKDLNLQSSSSVCTYHLYFKDLNVHIYSIHYRLFVRASLICVAAQSNKSRVLISPFTTCRPIVYKDPQVLL